MHSLFYSFVVFSFILPFTLLYHTAISCFTYYFCYLGVMKVTPAHDFKDYELGEKHKLPLKDVLSDEGTINVDVENFMVIMSLDSFNFKKKLFYKYFVSNFFFPLNLK